MARTREFDTEKAVEAAMNAFRLNGYDGTSIQDLVDATGVGRGSLYAAFGSKEGLYLAAMDRYRAYYALPLVELLRDGAPGWELLREVLVAAVDEIVCDGSRRACLMVGAAVGRIADDPRCPPMCGRRRRCSRTRWLRWWRRHRPTVSSPRRGRP